MQIWLDVLPITRAHRSILCVEILPGISIKESTALQINLIPSWSTRSSTLWKKIDLVPATITETNGNELYRA